jgi:ParB/RepB/Spo0J family partition protein
MKELQILDIPIEDIEDNPFYARKFIEFDDEDIGNLIKSFEKSGLIQPIVVRKNVGTGKKYQLIAGGRRKRAFQLLCRDKITAKIVEADDVEVRIMSLVENYHRKDLTVYEKEESIYELWKSGNEKGMFHNNLTTMEEWTGVPHQTISDIVNAEKEKEEDPSEEIQLSTSKDLQRTRILKTIPEVRKELLKGAVIKKTVKVLEIAEASKIISKFIDELHRDILADIAKLFTENKIKINNLEDFINIITGIRGAIDQAKVIKKIKKDYDLSQEEKIDIYKLKKFVDIYNNSFEDVKERLLNYNISIDEAKDLNLFETRVGREKVLVDLRNYDKEIEYIEKEKIKYIKEMQKKADSFEAKEDEQKNIKIFEIEKEEDKVIKRIFKIRRELLFFDSNEINNYEEEVRQKAIEMVWEVYKSYREILVELGEIKDTSVDDSRE